jgi:hypothetical protein
MASAAVVGRPINYSEVIPRHKDPVKVDAKEVEEIVLLRKRIGFSRLDLGPFLVAYALVTAALVNYAIAGQWCAPCGSGVPPLHETQCNSMHCSAAS